MGKYLIDFMLGSCKSIFYLVFELLNGEVFKVFLHSFGLYQYYYCKAEGGKVEGNLRGKISVLKWGLGWIWL